MSEMSSSPSDYDSRFKRVYSLKRLNRLLAELGVTEDENTFLVFLAAEFLKKLGIWGYHEQDE